ncbi:General alpha-glucoside permease [Tolypocladium capitatum]|uniref:General alpha-glucoside permease n=1 Tax=Tolypocladium capitatum TaxID=45235 RepID=A0A2K3QKH7_9HYPO|nr:General alpha-glucoside permease [Tolypocladium capitatum]
MAASSQSEAAEDRAGPPSPAQLDDGSSSTAGNARLVSAEQDRDRIHEGSPLLSSDDSDEDGSGSGAGAWALVDETQTTKSLWYMTMLTISIGGLQIAWSVELSNGSPYLLSLGLSKSLMALVWIAGPLTGTLVVPYVGILGDNCRLPWGKRRPFMVGGTVVTILGLLFLAWAKEIVAGVLGIFGADATSNGVRVAIITAAVIGIYVLDIAINTVQAATRAFMVDCAPAHQQELANAMASRLTGIGNIVGFIAGYVNLPEHLWFLGDTQFKILCVIACIALSLTIALSTSLIHERDPRIDGPPAKKTPGILPFFFGIFKSIKRLPPQTKRVCQVQFYAWVGFFPLLFYTSSYIGEIYVQPYLEDNPNMTPEELEALYEQATRIGTFALLINAIVSLLTNVFLPFFIAPTFDSRPVLAGAPGETAAASKASDNEEHRSFLEHLRIPGFTLKRAWFGSLVLFAGAMFCTPLVRSVEAATALIGVAGVTWAMTLWAPWAIISAEISRRDALDRARKLQDMSSHGNAMSRREHSPDHDAGLRSNAEGNGEEVDQAGVILGIHNMAIAVPQMIATVGSSIIFKIWQKPRGTPGDHSIAIVMALGGAFVLVASLTAARIRDDAPAPSDEIIDEERGESNESPLPAPAAPYRKLTKSGYQSLPETGQGATGPSGG